MNSALFARTSGVFPYPGDGVTDFTGKEGYLVTSNTLAGAGTAGLLNIAASLTVPACAVVLDGIDSARQSTMMALGGDGAVRLRAHAAIQIYDRLAQFSDGTVITDPGPGTGRVIVGVALEAAAAGDFFMAKTLTPTIAA